MNNSTPIVVASSMVSWQQGEYSSPRPSWTEVTDENGHKVKTVNDYTGGRFNQVTRACDYDNGNNKLRCNINEYENNSSYIGQTDANGYYSGRHIFNLVKATGVENPDGTRASLTEYEYDGQPLSNADGVIQHDHEHNPHTTMTRLVRGQCLDPANISGNLSEENPCTEYEWTEVSLYDSSTAARGNVTKVKNYTDAQTPSGEIDETRKFDIAGNMLTASSSCCQQVSYQYTSGTQYAYPESQTSGASDVNSPDRITTSATYNYETGLIRQSTNTNGRNFISYYHPDTLRQTTSYSSTGAYTSYTYDDAAMTVTREVKEANGNLADKFVKYLNGLGEVRREEALNPNSVWDIVETKYNKLGQVWKHSRPYRAGETVQWSETLYDKQGRTIKVIEPDGGYSQAFYNESQHPDSATLLSTNTLPAGNTIRVADPWGRDRWGRYDQQGRLVEVIEPNPDRVSNAGGSVLAAGSLVTKYKYDTLDRLVEVEQGNQHRYFRYDSLGRLTGHKLAEQSATLNDIGQYVGAGNPAAKWSEVFWYDNRSNMTMKIDARGVKTHFSYQVGGAEDPLNRLQAVIYDLSGPLDPNLPIHASSNSSYEYMTTGDKTRIKKIRTDGILTEDIIYDVEGRVSEYTQTVDYRQSYPMTVSYLYDTINRVTEVRYPAQYGLTGSPRKVVQHSYDLAGRLTSLKVDGQQQAGDIFYNASDQTTSIKIGVAGANQVTENYIFDPQNGLLTNQKVLRNNQALLDLSYEYNRNNSAGTLNGKTGHLTKIVNNLDNNKNREYEFDALGRLTKAKGGNNLWQQQYSYDRYGNRTNVAASGVAADNSAVPSDGIPSLSYNSSNNRITTSNANGQFEYDSAGNQIRALSEDGQTWLRYEYDAANRIRVVRKDDGTYLQAFQYGATNARLMDYDYGSNQLKLFAGNGGTTYAEYTEFIGQQPTWTKSYTYLGDTLLATTTPNGQGAETTEYSHPDRLGTRTITNQAAGTSYEQTTLPFGTALNAESTRTNNPNRFTSYNRSERTGLDYALNRTYDSKQGRFTQVDPVNMNAVSLTRPQTLNLYTYCGNDPVNHTDPSGLFFGSLFRWIGKALKVIMIAVAVFIAVAAMIAMPELAPVLGKAFFAKLFLLSGSLFAQAVAPPKIGAVIGIITGMILSGPGIIVNIAGTAASKVPTWQRLLAATSFVGSVSNSLAAKRGKKKPSDKSIIRSSVNSALWRIRSKPGCKQFLQEEFKGLDPEKVLSDVFSKGQVVRVGSMMQIGGGVAQTNVGAGSNGQIRLSEKWFDDANVGGWVGTLNRANARTMVLLHEVKHLVGTPHDHIFKGGKLVARDDMYFYRGIAQNCFGVYVPESAPPILGLPL
ncbi:MAG TPA: RHS repeat-associated core domain-containing protein [Fibrella sp.]